MDFAELNEEQLRAVHHIDNPLLILAGAGSGKTKTITTRLAYLIKEVGISPDSTLTLTFTNKAARQMRERAIALLGYDVAPLPLLCTFHKFGLLFLRLHIRELGRESNFVILDSDDCKKIIKKLDKDLKTDIDARDIKQILNYISWCKNNFVNPSMVDTATHNEEEKRMQAFYEEYQNFLSKNNMVDFDDLLYLPNMILVSNAKLAQSLSNQYQYIMVDEYQDTNAMQNELLAHLTCTHKNICVVGDDDQSIYSWRGADVRNILNFDKRFANTTIVKLTKNYRSNASILEAANHLIANNTQRHDKRLVAVRENIEKIKILKNANEDKEGETIAGIIKDLLESGVNPNQIAVLFRINALTRSLETSFSRAKLPFKFIGTMPFFERAEVKDMLSYLRLLVNPHDDFSFLRVINCPKRGFGKTSQDKLENLAKARGISIYQLFLHYEQQIKEHISPLHIKILRDFFELIDFLRSVEDFSEFIDEFEGRIDFRGEYKNNSAESIDKIANINEFFGYLRDFADNEDFKDEYNKNEKLEDFLNNMSLSSNMDLVNDEYVQCMSVHSSKGLEFEHVFVIGLEEENFPLNDDLSNLEEERRLAYVAFTRAKNNLYLSSVQSRFLRGRRESLVISRFIKEANLLESTQNIRRSESEEGIDEGVFQQSNSEEIVKNDIVTHKVFGTGRVLEVIQGSKGAQLRINFGGVERRILESFVKKI